MSFPNVIQDISDLENKHITDTSSTTSQINTLKSRMSSVESGKVNTTDLINLIYPVGSIYMSVNNVSPSTFLGGTWERIQDRFLLGAGSSYEAGSTGGEASHKHTLSSNGGATIRKYGSQFIMGRITTAGNMPNSVGSLGNDGSWWITNANGDTATKQIDTTKFTGISLYGNTDITTNLPPYLAVYIWKRTY